MTDYFKVINILSAGLSFLDSLGFTEPVSSIEKSKLLGEYMMMIYTSKVSDRSIEVCYSEAKDKYAAAVAVFICNKSGLRFSLEDWIKEKSINPIQFVANKNIIIEDFLKRFCSDCRTVLEGPLRKTITGEEWDSAPIDWKGYR